MRRKGLQFYKARVAKRCVAMILLVAVVIAQMTPIRVSAENPIAHWGKTAMDRWQDNGVMTTDGKDLDIPVSRGDMAVFLDHLMHFKNLSPNTFQDLEDNSPYKKALLGANKAGIIIGDGVHIHPDEFLTREEACAMLTRAFGIAPVEGEPDFKDADSIATWAKGSVAAMAQQHILQGFPDGSFYPQKVLTKAQIAVILNNAIGAVYNAPGKYSGEINGIVIINVDGVILKDVAIKGKLIIAEGVGEGETTLENVLVSDQTIVRGGGTSNILLKGSTHLGNITVDYRGEGRVSVKNLASSAVSHVVAKQGSLDIDGNVDTIAVQCEQLVTIHNGKIQQLTIEGSSTMMIAQGAAISHLTVTTPSTIQNNGIIQQMSVTANNVIVTGNRPEALSVDAIVKQQTMMPEVTTSGLINDYYTNDKKSTPTPIPTPIPEDQTVNISPILGVVAPVSGAVPVKKITETDQYTGLVTWSGAPSVFEIDTIYTATIILTAKAGYTLKGVHKDFFTVANGKDVTNNMDSGVITVTFPKTDGETTWGIPENLRISNVDETSTTIVWSPVHNAQTYNVYRSESKFGTYTVVGTVQAPASFFTDQTQGRLTPLSRSSYYKVTAKYGATETAKSQYVSRETDVFGADVMIYSPKDDTQSLLGETKEIFRPAANYKSGTEWGQFSNNRYAYLFKPGNYLWEDEAPNSGDKADDAKLKIGFYTHVAGLGKVPTDTVIPKMYVTAEWLGTTKGTGSASDFSGNSTCNFWRTIENVTLDSDTLWGVSQAAPLRRLNINGSLALATTYGRTSGNWASGGFLADSAVSGTLLYNGQQQWLTRNSQIGGSAQGQWNMVHVGVIDQNNTINKTQARYTNVEKAPVIQEKPFLYINDAGDYNVFVPGVRYDALGTSWHEDNMGIGSSLSLLEDFYVAKPSDRASMMNAALEAGKHLLLTPGIYHLSEPLHVTKANTVIFGLGLASLINDGNYASMIIEDVDGVKVSGIIFDAGPNGSPTLLKVGQDKSANADANNPTLLQDLFFRVGGDEMGKAEVCIEINRQYTIGDDFWVWRADHGQQVSWFKNTTKNGLVVNGDDVTIYGLMCEHFHEYQTLWNGERGKVFFYQSEIPYDVASQGAWTPNGITQGYASYKVADNVNVHEAWGLGIYSCPSRTGAEQNGAEYIVLDSAIEIPNKDGVKIHNGCTLNLANPNGNYANENTPSIKNVINNVGGAVWGITTERKYVAEYCNFQTGVPLFNVPAQGNYRTPQQVTLTHENPEITEIRYTTDGSMPSATNGVKVPVHSIITVGVPGQVVRLTAMGVKGQGTSATSSVVIAMSDDLAVFGGARSSSNVNGTRTAAKAVNGIVTGGDERWEAATRYNEWLMVDLGATFDLSKIKLTWQSNNSIALNYKIAVSDHEEVWASSPWTIGTAGFQSPETVLDTTKWHVVQTVSGNKSETGPNNSRQQSFDFSEGAATGRYILIDCKDTANYGFSIWELEAYGAEYIPNRVNSFLIDIPAPEVGEAGITTAPTDTQEISFGAISWDKTSVYDVGDTPVATIIATAKDPYVFDSTKWATDISGQTGLVHVSGADTVKFTRDSDTQITITIAFSVAPRYQVDLQASYLDTESGLTVSAKMANPSVLGYKADTVCTVLVTVTGSSKRASIYQAGITAVSPSDVEVTFKPAFDLGENKTSPVEKRNIGGIGTTDGKNMTTGADGTVSGGTGEQIGVATFGTTVTQTYENWTFAYTFTMPKSNVQMAFEDGFLYDIAPSIMAKANGGSLRDSDAFLDNVKGSRWTNANKHTPLKALNGQYNWATAGTDNRWEITSNVGHWVVIDLGDVYNISDVVLRFRSSAIAPVKYWIDVSNDVSDFNSLPMTPVTADTGASTPSYGGLPISSWQNAWVVVNGGGGSSGTWSYNPLFAGAEATILKLLGTKTSNGLGPYVGIVDYSNNDSIWSSSVPRTGQYIRFYYETAQSNNNFTIDNFEIYGTFVAPGVANRALDNLDVQEEEGVQEEENKQEEQQMQTEENIQEEHQKDITDDDKEDKVDVQETDIPPFDFIYDSKS